MSRSFSSTHFLTLASGLGAGLPCSFSMWFRPGGVTATEVIAAVMNADGTRGFYFVLRGAEAGDPIDAIHLGNSGSATARSTTGVTSGAWHHVGAVFGGEASRAVFLDGAKTSNTTNAGSMPALTQTNLGRISTAATGTLTGALAEVAVWSAALSDEEMISLARAWAPRRVRPQSLLEYWPLVGRESPEPGIKGLSLTVSGAAAAEHPRIYR